MDTPDSKTDRLPAAFGAAFARTVVATLAVVIALSTAGCASDPRADGSVARPVAAAAAAEPPAPAVLFPALNVLDLEKTVAFYVDYLGMNETLRLGDATTERIEVTLSHGDANGPGASLVLQRENGRTKPYAFDAFSRIAFRVKDLDGLVARMRAAGTPVLVEPHFIEAMDMKIRLAFVQDPNGARVELIEIVPR